MPFSVSDILVVSEGGHESFPSSPFLGAVASPCFLFRLLHIHAQTMPTQQVDDGDWRVQYSFGWSQDGSPRSFDGSLHGSATPGSTATLTFIGMLFAFLFQTRISLVHRYWGGGPWHREEHVPAPDDEVQRRWGWDEHLHRAYRRQPGYHVFFRDFEPSSG